MTSGTNIRLNFDSSVNTAQRMRFLFALSKKVRQAGGDLSTSKQIDPPQNIVLSLMKAGKITQDHFTTVALRVEVRGLYSDAESWKLIASSGEKDTELDLDIQNKTVEGISIKDTTIESAINELENETGNL